MRKEDKKEFLFDAMSEIDEKIIDAAERYPLVVAKRRRFIRSAVSIAAAFAIIIAAIPVIGPLKFSDTFPVELFIEIGRKSFHLPYGSFTLVSNKYVNDPSFLHIDP